MSDPNSLAGSLQAIRLGCERKVYAKGEKILPEAGKTNILVTSALPYVNNVPHLGNIIGSVLSADVFARYQKARNNQCLFICGTDEYGTATETKALEDGITPKELCDKYYAIHSSVYSWFEIEFDEFGRTTTQEQTDIAQEIFMALYDNGYLQEDTQTQLFCTKHSGFLADRFVEGTCPHCSYEDARGDQCDSCGKLLNPFELIRPRCKLDGTSPEPRDTKHIFLCLDKLQPELEQWTKQSSKFGNWSSNGIHITEAWLKEGLHPRCITRDLTWGTPVPLESMKDKVLYVWFDACIGYVSITAKYTKDWEQWWRNPENVQLYQFMGKDNVPFHTVVFPSSQLGTQQKWTMLHCINTTEYLQYENRVKFSKSRSVGVFGDSARETGVPPSVWRYYLLANRPETSDTEFSWREFITRNNSELLANLGNFVNRVVKFVASKYQSTIPEYDTSSSMIGALRTDLDEMLKQYNEAMSEAKIREGLRLVMAISARGNLFLQDNKLDNNLFTNERQRADDVVGTALNLIYIISAIVYPFMPSTGANITRQLNAPDSRIPDAFKFNLLPGHRIGEAAYLFSRIDPKKEDEWRAKYAGQRPKAKSANVKKDARTAGAA